MVFCAILFLLFAVECLSHLRFSLKTNPNSRFSASFFVPLHPVMSKREYIQANKDWLVAKSKEDGVKALPKGISRASQLVPRLFSK